MTAIVDYACCYSMSPEISFNSITEDEDDMCLTIISDHIEETNLVCEDKPIDDETVEEELEDTEETALIYENLMKQSTPTAVVRQSKRIDKRKKRIQAILNIRRNVRSRNQMHVVHQNCPGWLVF